MVTLLLLLLLLWSNVTIIWTCCRSIERKWRSGLCKLYRFKVTLVVLILQRLLRLVMVVVVLVFIVVTITTAELLLLYIIICCIHGSRDHLISRLLNRHLWQLA